MEKDLWLDDLSQPDERAIAPTINATGTWSPSDLRWWRLRLSRTQAQAAEMLGISLRAYSDRENGKSSIARECTLACLYIEKWGG
jgi:DNA-binding XRE family transcriptional regulator